MASVDALNKGLAPLGTTAQAGGLGRGSDMGVTLNSLSAILTLMLVAALGVRNGVLLDTRERVREVGVQEALASFRPRPAPGPVVRPAGPVACGFGPDRARWMSARHAEFR
ncbi:hypothetical protein ABZ371_04670 [Streptomyces sp. NPDC005899]|uniref:hypothetical protein n=1 Tax=Streptomyces sp. NPDC005899 TaxID=3155716 RepID=UPI0033FDDFCF